MGSYRLYCFDGADRLWVADRVEGNSDEDAIEAARALDTAIKCEVWEGRRLVATLDRSPHIFRGPKRAPDATARRAAGGSTPSST